MDTMVSKPGGGGGGEALPYETDGMLVRNFEFNP